MSVVSRHYVPFTPCAIPWRLPRPALHDGIAREMDAEEGLHSEREFRDLEVSYRATGGLASGEDLARLLADQCRGDFIGLARHIADGKVFGFNWQCSFWIPMFQFELSDLSLREPPRQVRAELEEHYAGWGLAAWFVQPSVWLGLRTPLDLLGNNLSAVLQAARADRFVAAG